MNNEFINIRVILDRLLRHPLLQSLTLDTAVSYIEDFIKIAGAPVNYTDKVETITIENNRIVAPEGCVKINQIRDSKTKVIYKVNTDNFFGAEEEYNSLYYKIQGSFIYFSVNDREIELSYKSIPLDDEGFPLLLNNTFFIRALELYIKKQYFTILFDLGKISQQVYNNTQQEYAFAVGQCQSNLIKPSLDEFQVITNVLNSMIPKIREHSVGFKTLGIQDV